MFDVGRVCVKIAGRDAGKQCAVVDVLDHQFVLVDGETRRRKVNVKHLEPTERTVDISKSASHDEIKELFQSLGITIKDSTPKKKAARPRRVKKEKKVIVKKPARKAKVDKPESLESTIEEKKKSTKA